MRTLAKAIIGATLPALFAAPATAQSNETPAEGNSIVVIGEAWEKEQEKIEDQSKALIRPTRTSAPVARYFDSLCLTTWNISERFAKIIQQRIEANAEEAGVKLAEEGCAPNALVAIVKDVETDFARLKDEHGYVFGDLKKYQIARAERGASAVRSWNVVESRGRDGRPFQSIEIGIDGGTGGGQSAGRDVALNQQTSGGRLNDTVRRDMIMSVVLFDIDALNGASLTQLSDFATMRLLAQTYEAEEDSPPQFSTILSLFTDPIGTPPGLSRFDKAMLQGLYGLPASARYTAMYEATSSVYRKLLADELGVDLESAE